MHLQAWRAVLYKMVVALEGFTLVCFVLELTVLAVAFKFRLLQVTLILTVYYYRL
jgi:hypothetical protein